MAMQAEANMVGPARKVITALIVDDERLSRDAIRLRLVAESDISVVGEAASGTEAVRLIIEAQPDVVFLDVKMPGLDGFEVIDRISPFHLPIVIFVTAHDRFAVRAFERHALDYLLKPFTASRFSSTLARTRLEIAKGDERSVHHRLIALLDERQRDREAQANPATSSPPRYLARFAVPRNGRIVLVRAEDVEWIESSANYARLHVGSVSHLVRMTMTQLERSLDPSRFVRIHRSTIVRTDCIEAIVPILHGDFSVTLRDGTVVRLSRNYRGRLQR